MYKVVVTDHVFESLDIERRILSKIGAEVYEYQCTTREEVINVASDADAVLITNFQDYSKEVIKNLRKCKVIVKYGIGVDRIDIEEATNRGIMIVNIPDYCLEEVSDHAVSLTLALARKLLYSDRKIRKNLEHKPMDLKPIKGLANSTVGIIGFGRIGKLSARKIGAFGSKIVFYDPYIKGDHSEGVVTAENVPLDRLLAESDFIILHAPGTKENYHMLNKNTFNKMLKKPYIVNVGRGELIDTGALVDALDEGLISGAGLDVVEGVPPVRQDDPLLKYDNIILTPHSAWYSQSSLNKLQTTAAEEVKRVLLGEIPVSLVNKEVINILRDRR